MERSRHGTFALSTGCRLNEILSAKWADVDLEKQVLTVRATNSKSRKVRYVPLNASAMDVINSLDTRDRYEYLFVNEKTRRPFVNITKVWHRLRRKAGLPTLRIHDLRHAFASTLVGQGRTIYEVMVLLRPFLTKGLRTLRLHPNDNITGGCQ